MRTKNQYFQLAEGRAPHPTSPRGALFKLLHVVQPLATRWRCFCASKLLYRHNPTTSREAYAKKLPWNGRKGRIVAFSSFVKLKALLVFALVSFSMRSSMVNE